MSRSLPLIAVFFAALLQACADSRPPAAPEVPEPSAELPAGVDAAAISQKLTELVGAAPDELRGSAGGLLEARWGTNFAYVTADGAYVIYGDMLDLQSGHAITDASRKRLRRTVLAELTPENTIEFSPRNTRHLVTVFTDIDCGYCRKLHREMDQYHAEGIAIRYVFYPRSGPGTDSFRKAEAVWCANDRHAALTAAKDGQPVAGDGSCENPVLKEYQLGQQVGLRGTPMMVLPDGEVINGYVPAKALAEQLASGRRG